MEKWNKRRIKMLQLCYKRISFYELEDRMNRRWYNKGGGRRDEGKYRCGCGGGGGCVGVDMGGTVHWSYPASLGNLNTRMMRAVDQQNIWSHATSSTISHSLPPLSHLLLAPSMNHSFLFHLFFPPIPRFLPVFISPWMIWFPYFS